MAENAYHMEALRKKRLIERTQEARSKLLNKSQGIETQDEENRQMKDDVIYSGPGHFEQNRLAYNWLGTARDRKQYDHSRNGPVMARSWSGLRRELYGIGQGTPLGGKGHPITFTELQQIRYIAPKP